MTFEELGLHPRIVARLTEAGLRQPTPIQTKAIPLALSGRDADLVTERERLAGEVITVRRAARKQSVATLDDESRQILADDLVIADGDADDRLLDTYDLDAADLFFIDDHEPNIVGAEAMGIHAHHFHDASGLRADLASQGLLGQD